MKTIYTNGEVYTGELPLCQAFAVEQGRFVYAGSNEEAIRLKEEGDDVVDLEGRFVCAGFNDSHMHVINFGRFLGMANLAEHTDSLADVKAAMKAFIAERKPAAGTWVRGRGWNQDYFTDESRFPVRQDLDEISTEHPICLTRACGHVCVVNTMALRMLGMMDEKPSWKSEGTIQAEEGCIELGEDGKPNGIFRENAMDLVFACFPQPEKEDIKEMILQASGELNRYGITSSHSDDLLEFSQVSFQGIIDAYRELEAEGKMTIRVNQQSRFLDFNGLKEFTEQGYYTGWGDEWFRIGPMKLLGDGSLGARTAYMSQPYADDPSTRGIPIFTRKQLEEMIGYAHTHGMQIAIHAIGDGILDDILAGYEKALTEHPKADHRHGIVHCQVMRPDQIQKIQELSLHAYIQSIFLDYDIHIVEERVGRERAASSYNYRTLYDTVHTSNGSDCPVELPNVLAGIQCAVTRTTLKDHIGPYLPEQALTVKQAIDSFTKEGAHASFEEEIKGQIRPGMLADFVVLGKNPFAVDAEQIHKIPVCATYVGGICRYRREKEIG
ncbi:MAG: amidohydrolase [Lachnospiraceae bacterium]|nr:amidohydrolase [Lachnospiraceae bacterium]